MEDVDLTRVRGIGPATAVKLHGAGIRTAQALARAEVEHLVQIVGRATSAKIVKNARDLLDEEGIPYRSEDLPKEEIEAAEDLELDETDEEVPEEEPEELEELEEDLEELEEVQELEEVEAEVEEEEKLEGDLTMVEGIGPKTQSDLIEAGFNTVEKLANAPISELTKVDGVGKKTAEMIVSNAQEVVGATPEPEEEEEEEVELAEIEDEDLGEDIEEPMEVEDEDLEDREVRTEHERSPTPQGIPTKKKRGVQISSDTEKIDLDELDETKAEEKSGWQVKAKELTEEEREARRKRQEMLRAQERITREIPEPPKPVKAKKAEKQEKGEKPVKKAKKSKKVKKQVKKTKAQKKAERFVDYYSNKDIHPREIHGRPRVEGKATGESEPRIELDRDTYLGKITSKRRSRRNINNRQVIVNLDNGFDPEQLVGKKVYFTYPDTETKITGSVTKRFGKKSSGKVLLQFKKGLREEAIFEKVYIY